MPLNLGSSAVSLYLGDQRVAGYLGSQIVIASVPGAPTIDSASVESSNGIIAYSPPSSDGGSAITEYAVYFGSSEPIALLGTFSEGALEGSIFFDGSGWVSGDVLAIAAINEVGQGPKSNILEPTVL